MRVVAIFLVALGALILADQSFGLWTRPRPDDADKTAWVPLVIGGIAIVSGLLMLSTEQRRD